MQMNKQLIFSEVRGFAFLKQDYRIIFFFKGGFRKQFFFKSLKLKIQFKKKFNAIEDLGDETEETSKKDMLKREKIVKKR